MTRSLRFVKSVLPALGLLAVAEVAVRVGAWADPTFMSVPLPDERNLFRRDPDLFWSLRPGLGVRHEGARVRTNSLGLRSHEVGAKGKGEVRVLSLGESSTFGVGVANGETYSAVLENLLNAESTGEAVTYRVVNAGVSAYSSFQSLTYLELRGVELEPDVVVFYHELNDYLPSSLRGSDNTELGISQTDAELYHSRKNAVRRVLLRHSDLFRYLDLRLARHRIERFQAANAAVPRSAIGLPDFRLDRRVRLADRDVLEFAGIRERTLPQRVSQAERLDILERLRRLCEARGMRLVVIHPAYRKSSPHDCMLTQFCRIRGVPMVEAHDALHPPDAERDALFLDSWHPNRAGHRRLAEALFRRFEAEGWSGPRSGSDTADPGEGAGRRGGA
jgi:lysophospholipase L1-like esterase